MNYDFAFMKFSSFGYVIAEKQGTNKKKSGPLIRTLRALTDMAEKKKAQCFILNWCTPALSAVHAKKRHYVSLTQFTQHLYRSHASTGPFGALV